MCSSKGGLVVDAEVTSDVFSPITSLEAKHVLWIALAKLVESCGHTTVDDLDLYLVPNRKIMFWSLKSNAVGTRRLLYAPKGRLDDCMGDMDDTNTSVYHMGHPFAYVGLAADSQSDTHAFQLNQLNDTSLSIVALRDLSSSQTEEIRVPFWDLNPVETSVEFTAPEVENIKVRLRDELYFLTEQLSEVKYLKDCTIE